MPDNNSSLPDWLKNAPAQFKETAQKYWEQLQTTTGFKKDEPLDAQHMLDWAKKEGGNAVTYAEGLIKSLKEKGIAVFNDNEPKAEGFLQKAANFIKKNVGGFGGGAAGLIAGIATGNPLLTVLFVIGGLVGGSAAIDKDGVIRGHGETPAPGGASEKKDGTGAAMKVSLDLSNPDQVKALQQNINDYNALAHPGNVKPLELTGTMDENTKAEWVQFKKEVWTDGLPSIGYLKDRLKLTDAEFKELKIDPKDPKSFDRAHPSKEVIKKIEEKLGIMGGPDQMTDELKERIRKDKVENWTDATVNDSAVKMLSQTVEALKAASIEKQKNPGVEQGGQGRGGPPGQDPGNRSR